MKKAKKDLKITAAKARWLTPQGMQLRKQYSRWAKSVWNTDKALRVRRQMSRELRMLYTNTEHLGEELESLLLAYRPG